MILTKIILTSNLEVLKLAIEKFSLIKKDNEKNILIYEGKIIIDDEVEKIIFINLLNMEDVFDYISENYIYQKMFFIQNVKSFLNFELKDGDIVIPNTIISSTNLNNAFFTDLVVGENYDLTKFGLILNGICLSSESDKIDNLEEGFYADILDKNSYKVIGKHKSINLNFSIVILGIVIDNEEKIEYFENALNILDILL